MWVSSYNPRPLQTRQQLLQLPTEVHRLHTTIDLSGHTWPSTTQSIQKKVNNKRIIVHSIGRKRAPKLWSICEHTDHNISCPVNRENIESFARVHAISHACTFIATIVNNTKQMHLLACTSSIGTAPVQESERLPLASTNTLIDISLQPRCFELLLLDDRRSSYLASSMRDGIVHMSN